MPLIKEGLFGIDVNRYQASADGKNRMDVSKAAPFIYFAGLRATVGVNGLDYQYYYHLQEFGRFNVPLFPYHVPKLDKSIPKQLEAFVNACFDQEGKYVGQLPPAFDLEAIPDNFTKQQVDNIVTKMHFDYINLMDKRGFVPPWDDSILWPMWYSNKGTWDGRKARSDWPKLYPFWAAHYPWDNIQGPDKFPTVQYIREDYRRPLLPADLVDINNPVEELIWQFSGRNKCGFQLGSAGDDDIDLNVLDMTLSEFNQKFNLNMTERLPFPEGLSIPPVPPVEPPPSEEEWMAKITGHLNVRLSPEILNSNLRGAMKAGDRIKIVGPLVNDYFPAVIYLYNGSGRIKPA